jgi:hypothetical protein
MQFFGIPRLDANAEGIHLVWSWPDTLPLSAGGWDIQRLNDDNEKLWRSTCETIGTAVINQLVSGREYPALLGPLRLQSNAAFAAIAPPSPSTFAAAASATIPSPADPLTAAARSNTFEVFIQELTQPVERATVAVSAKIAIAMAMSDGKVVATTAFTALTTPVELRAPAIDTIRIYTVAAQQFTICAYTRFVPAGALDPWATAPYIVKGLTLPLHETDPTLTTPDQEFATATARLAGTETLHRADFDHLTASLRAAVAAAASGVGRSGERTLLVRDVATEPFEELPLDTSLGALALHPKTRRILGFGYRDRAGLTPNATYFYRITGRFDAADLTDDIYDVHRIASSTVLPNAFFIRDLSVRFQSPVSVVLDPPAPATGLQSVSRRGIKIDTSRYDASWLIAPLENWSAVFTFPRAVSTVVLEVAPGHTFSYAAGDPWAFGAPALTPLPAGPRVALTFTTPVWELRLAGSGTLFALRLPSGQTGTVDVHAFAGPMTYAAQPLPAPPLEFNIVNLDQPAAILTGEIDESTPIAQRLPAGFMLTWLPAATNGLAIWPNDVDAAPPIDAIAYQIEHRVVQPPSTDGAWEPIAGSDNLSFGTRDPATPDDVIALGCNLDAIYPAIRPRGPDAALTIQLSDVFGQTDPTTGVTRPAEPYGSYHQYQIGAFDAVGRVSPTMTLSNVARLEKHTAPPTPVAPQPETVVDATGHFTGRPGVRARPIVKGARGLSADDITLLGTHENAILLEWGWRASERDLDPTTTEFRVYSSRPLDAANATVTSVASAQGAWQMAFATDMPLIANELAGLWITSGGYPFLVLANDAGTSPGVRVETSALQPARQPMMGPLAFDRALLPHAQRAAGWDDRVAVIPLAADDTYRYVFYDVLNLTVAQPADSLWIGVSAADAQPYVDDERTTGANANRPGNESGIAACSVSARYVGQPTFSVPPPLAAVPELVTDEPTQRPVLVTLDLPALLGTALPAGAPIALERCSSDDVLSCTSVSGTDVIVTHADGTTEIIAFPNPTDHAAVLASLESAPQEIADNYLMHIVAGSSDPSAFFARISADLATFATVDDALAPKPGRFLYFVRAADANGRLSDGGAIVPVVVRVPSTSPASTPVRRTLASAGGNVSLTVAFGSDPATTTALLFAAIAPPGSDAIPSGDATIMRMANRRDLYPHDGLRLRLPDGTIVAPLVVKNLADADVVVDASGNRTATLTAAATPKAWATLWCFGLSRDGFPSFACGPYGTRVLP